MLVKTKYILSVSHEQNAGQNHNIKLANRKMMWTGLVACMEEKGIAFWVFMGKSEGKRKLGMPRRRWEYNTKMHLNVIGLECLDWISLA
jgi:hypothetical protein